MRINGLHLHSSHVILNNAVFEKGAQTLFNIARQLEHLEYIDFGEAAGLNISQLGALQIASEYEKLIDRGIRGSVIHAPTDAIYEAAKTMIATLVSVGGERPEGYRLTRTPLAIRDVPAFLHSDSAEVSRLVA